VDVVSPASQHREWVTKPGRPSGARMAACTLLSVGGTTFAITTFFVIAVVHEADSVLEIVGVAAGMLIFYAPALLWSGGLWSIPAIFVVGLVAAVLTHRYRVTGVSSRWQRAGRVVFALLLAYTGWTLIIGLVFLVSLA
jgi:hypothetical protein